MHNGIVLHVNFLFLPTLWNLQLVIPSSTVLSNTHEILNIEKEDPEGEPQNQQQKMIYAFSRLIYSSSSR